MAESESQTVQGYGGRVDAVHLSRRHSGRGDALADPAEVRVTEGRRGSAFWNGCLGPGEEHELQVDFAKPAQDGVCNDHHDLPSRQIVFFLRHAESRWNRAQADYALVSMMWENDHGLSEDGRKQAEDLCRRIDSARRVMREAAEAEQRGETQGLAQLVGSVEYSWLQHFLLPDAIFSSPFTRAVCTAAISLKDVLVGQTLKLLPEAREQKNLGGADSTGVAVGQDISKHVEADLMAVYAGEGKVAQQRAMDDFRQIQLDVSDVSEEWWGSYTGETEDALLERVSALLSRLRHTRGSRSLPGGGGVSIVVSHSLLLRTMFKRYLRSAPDHRFDRIWRSLQEQILPYAGVVGAVLEWDAQGRCDIVEASPLLSTELLPPTMSLLIPDDGATSPRPMMPKSTIDAIQFLLPSCACSRREPTPSPSCTTM